MLIVFVMPRNSFSQDIITIIIINNQTSKTAIEFTIKRYFNLRMISNGKYAL